MSAPNGLYRAALKMVQENPVLPANLDAERLVLGSVLLDDSRFPEGLTVDAFSIERHRRLWRRMCDMRARGDAIDRVTLHNELQRRGEAEADSLSFITSLDDGMPHIPRLDAYIRILSEYAQRRRLMFACENLKSRASLGSENLTDLLAEWQDLFTAGAAAGQAYQSIENLPLLAECGATDVEYIRQELPRGAVTAFTGDAGSGKSTAVTAFMRDAWHDKGIPSLFLDRENPVGVLAERLTRLGMEDGPGIRFWHGGLAEEAPQPDSPIVRAWVKETKGIVVVDSFSAFLEGGDQNDAAIVRAFMHRCRRLADAGATVAVIHHDGKAETAKDYRGSSDFKAAIDSGYHVSNFSADGRLDKLVLRPFKSRMGVTGEISYDYADGRFVRADANEVKQTVSEQLAVVLRLNPGITARKFDELVKARGLGRDRGRTFLSDGVLSGAIRRETGSKNEKRYYPADFPGGLECAGSPPIGV